MVPMAIPTFGGMVIQTMTIFVVPIFQTIWRESAVKRNSRKAIQSLNNGEHEENSDI
jgi:Cu(I)/Ag(I) efflux system membrane protein CusA/SilA